MALTDDGPQQLAAQVLAEHRDDPAWIDAFIDTLSCARSGHQVTRVLEVWGLSQAELADAMGVSRQAVGKWMSQVPADRAVDLSNLAAASDVLERHLKRDRIPAVVRRRAPALGDLSLVELISTAGTSAVLTACRQMFDVAAVSV